MIQKSQENFTKYPENLLTKASLERRDPILIAKIAGFSPAHVRLVLNGRRRMDSKIQDAIVKILTRRNESKQKFNSIINKAQ